MSEPKKLLGEKWSGKPRRSIRLPGMRMETTQDFLQELDRLIAHVTSSRQVTRPAMVRWLVACAIECLDETGELPFEWRDL